MTLAVQFRDAAQAFRLIDNDDAATVLVRYRGPGGAAPDALIGQLERDGPSRWLMRKLQRYGVTLYRHQLQALLHRGDVQEVASCPGLYVQTAGFDAFYDPVLGARVDSAPGDPAAYVA
jgi:CRISPR-associated endonuclease/helicase Cas3